MKDYDSSHDFYHILRVRNLALHIAKQEKIKDPKSLQLIELCAYLHDINDHKYINKDNEKASLSNYDMIKNILQKYNLETGNDDSYFKQLIKIIDNVSFSKEKKLISNYNTALENKLKKGKIKLEKTEILTMENGETKTQDQDKKEENIEENIDENKLNQDIKKYQDYSEFMQNCVELRIVQDADRIDAIGAIGIGRTFTFSGSRNRSMFNFVPNYVNYDCNDDTDSKNIKEWIDKDLCNGTCIGHFFEKLLILKNLMKTESGKKMAIERTNFMKLFVKQFCNEWDLSQ